MSKTLFTLWILIQVLVEVNCQMLPSEIYRHTATYVDNKLYILGGMSTITDSPLRGFFYLDVSKSFDTQTLSWQDLTNINVVPAHSSAASAKGGANNDTLFLFGGLASDQTMSLVYTFDPKSITWSTPKIAGINTAKRHKLTGIIDYDGKFYLWSGLSNGAAVNEMLIFDTRNLNWREGSVINAPIPRISYGTTLLPNNKIIYLGGVNNLDISIDDLTLDIVKGAALTLSEVYLYDTINDKWEAKTTSGKIPSNRAGFSSILGLDGQRIIIFGGYFSNPGSVDATYVLELENFTWYVPKISGKIPELRTLHQANVIDKYMVISFGLGYVKTVESDILLLDISNNEEYIWTTTFDPKNIISSPTPPPPPPPSSSSSPSPSPTSPFPPPPSPSSSLPPYMVGAIVGSSVVLSVIAGFVIYKWNKNKQKHITKTALIPHSYSNC